MVAAFLIASCTRSPAASSGVESTGVESDGVNYLEGLLWENGTQGAHWRFPADTDLTARFEDGRLTGSSGCNEYAATYTVGSRVTSTLDPVAIKRHAGEITIVSPNVTTQNACSPEVMAGETEFLANLASTKLYQADVWPGTHSDMLMLGSSTNGEGWVTFWCPSDPLQPCPRTGD